MRCGGSEVWRELYLGCQERVKREVAMDRYLIAGSSSSCIARLLAFMCFANNFAIVHEPPVN